MHRHEESLPLTRDPSVPTGIAQAIKASCVHASRWKRCARGSPHLGSLEAVHELDLNLELMIVGVATGLRGMRGGGLFPTDHGEQFVAKRGTTL